MNFIGNLSQLNANLQEIIKHSKEKTKNNTGVVLTVAINYGARDEIVNAIKNIIKDGKKENEITQELISKYLYTSNIPDPDLLIRTSGEERISNFLLYELAYAEFIFNKKYWPDYSKDDLVQDLQLFKTRNRRFGGLKDEKR